MVDGPAGHRNPSSSDESCLGLGCQGKIKKISADQKELTVTDQNGKDLEFVMDDDAKIQFNDKDTKLKELKKGDEITVTYEKKGRQV